MSDVPLIKIPIDTSEFDAFLDSYTKYQESLKEQPSAWEGVNHEVHGLQDGFSKALATFESLNALAGSSKLSGQNSFIAHFEKSSDGSAKAWAKIGKDVESTHKGLAGIGQLSITFSALGKDLLKGVGIGAAAYGAVVKSSADIAGLNLDARGLGLKIGQPQAFDAEFQQFGLSTADLSKMADIKGDRTKWTPLMSMGITQDDIQRDDPEELLVDFEKRSSKQFSTWQHSGQPAADMASAYGLTDVLSLQQLRAGASYQDTNPQAFDQQQDKYKSTWPQMAISQADADKATAGHAAFDSAWAKDKNAIESAFNDLTPELVKLTNEATDLITSFARSPEVKQGINDLADGLKSIDNFFHFTQKVNADPVNNPDAEAANKVHDLGRDFAHKAGSYFIDLWHSVTGKPQSAPDVPATTPSTFTADPNRKTNIDSLEELYKMPTGLLSAVEDIESGGGKHNVGKNGAYLGAFQFDQPTAKQYSVDVHDERSSEIGAARLLHDRFVKYGAWDKAIASYDGFAGLDKDIAKYGGSWRDHIGEFASTNETKNYLAGLRRRGVALDDPQGDKRHVAEQLAATVKPMRAPASTADQGNGDGPMFRMPQKSNQQTLPVAKVLIENRTSANVFSSLGGLTQ